MGPHEAAGSCPPSVLLGGTGYSDLKGQWPFPPIVMGQHPLTFLLKRCDLTINLKIVQTKVWLHRLTCSLVLVAPYNVMDSGGNVN